MGLSGELQRPKHTSTHKVHFTGRSAKFDTLRIDGIGDGVDRYWHCEQCAWYYAERSTLPGVLKAYTEAYCQDFDIMCRVCAHTKVGKMPTTETDSVDWAARVESVKERNRMRQRRYRANKRKVHEPAGETNAIRLV